MNNTTVSQLRKKAFNEKRNEGNRQGVIDDHLAISTWLEANVRRLSLKIKSTHTEERRH